MKNKAGKTNLIKNNIPGFLFFKNTPLQKLHTSSLGSLQLLRRKATER